MENWRTSLGKLNQPSGGRAFKFGDSPEGDWKTIFIAAVTLALMITALNIYIFVKIDKGEIFTVEGPALEGEQIPSLPKLRETVRYYQSKAAQFDNLQKTATSTFPDPSL